MAVVAVRGGPALQRVAGVHVENAPPTLPAEGDLAATVEHHLRAVGVAYLGGGGHPDGHRVGAAVDVVVRWEEAGIGLVGDVVHCTHSPHDRAAMASPPRFGLPRPRRLARLLLRLGWGRDADAVASRHGL